MRYQFVISRRANSDLISILNWFASQQATRAGERWLQGFLDLATTLEVHPERCPILFEADGDQPDVREALYGGGRTAYRIPFVIGERDVTILRIYHSARPDIRPDDL
jgi:plasmid stabilization system protein ParE